MKIDFGPSSFNLARDGVLLLHEAAGARVVCVAGALWLTQEGQEADIILEAGQSMRVTGPGLTLVTALRGSELKVIEPGRRGAELLRRLATWVPQSLARILPSA